MAYNLTYFLNGGTNNVGNPATFEAVDLPITLLDPTKEGYTFSGWYDNGDFIGLPVTQITEEADDVVYAKFTINQYTLEFTDHDDMVLQTADYDFGEDLSAVTPPEDPTREGYTFSGWDAEIPATMPAANTTIQATYTINQYTISFDSNGGSAVDDITDDYGEAVVEPAEPTKADLHFGGWYSDELLTTPYVFTTMPAENITVYARWYGIVTFDSNEGSGVIAQEVNENGYALEPEDPTREGHNFDAWYTDNGTFLNEFVFASAAITADITIYANWTIISYTLEFVDHDDSVLQTNSYDYGEDLSLVTPPADPTREGYTFTGWDAEIPATMPANDVTTKAQYTINEYTITINVNGGSAIDPITQDYATEVTTPDEPTKTGYTFDDWYSDEGLTTPYTFTTMPAEDITVYVGWTINQYTITFNSNEGSAVDPITQDYATEVVEPAEPTKTGYTFIDWYSDELLTTPYVFDTMPAEDITLHAGWEINKYTITIDVNGGSAIDPITQDYNTEVATPAEPTKTGYTFNDWYSDAELLTPYTFTTMPAEDITVYVGWTIVTYTVTYLSLYSAEHANPATFDVEDLDVTLTDPTERDGYIFAGWATKSLGIHTPITELTELIDYVLYAQWKLVGDYVALPIYAEDDYSYFVNKERIVEVNPVTINKNLHRVKVIISPGTIVLLAGLYETYAEALAVAEELRALIANIPAAA